MAQSAQPNSHTRSGSILDRVVVAREPTRILVLPADDQDETVWASNWRKFLASQLIPFLFNLSPGHRIALVVQGDTLPWGLLKSLGNTTSLEMNLYVSPIHIRSTWADFAAGVSFESDETDRALQLLRFEFDEAIVFPLPPGIEIGELRQAIDDFEIREYVESIDPPVAVVIHRDGRWFEFIGSERDRVLNLFGSEHS